MPAFLASHFKPQVHKGKTADIMITGTMNGVLLVLTCVYFVLQEYGWRASIQLTLLYWFISLLCIAVAAMYIKHIVTGIFGLTAYWICFIIWDWGISTASFVDVLLGSLSIAWMQVLVMLVAWSAQVAATKLRQRG